MLQLSAANIAGRPVTAQAHPALVQTRGCICRNVSADTLLDLEAQFHRMGISTRAHHTYRIYFVKLLRFVLNRFSELVGFCSESYVA